MATAQNIIKSFMAYLNNTSSQGTSALDGAVQAVSNFSSWSELKSTLVSDRSAYSGDNVSFLKDVCGIILDNSDTGAISGSDAGSDTTKTAESVVPETGSISYPSGTTFSTHGLKVTVPELSSLSESEKFIVGALYTWWINSALTMVEESFGFSFNSSEATVKEIDVQFYNSSQNTMAYVEYSTGKTCTTLHLRINMNYYDDIDTSDPNGFSEVSATYLDRTIAHEMVHAAMAANINYFSNLPMIFKEGSAELIHGIDDKRYSNLKSISESSSALKSSFNSTGTNGYTAGYVLLRYLAKQASEDRDPSVSLSFADTSTTTTDTTATSTTESTTSTTTTNSTQSNTTTTSSTTKGTAILLGTTLIVSGDLGKDIWLGGEGDTTYSISTTVTVNATSMTSSGVIGGNDRDNFISAGSGVTTLWGGASGDDTLTGGSGQDLFCYIFGGGNDVAKSFTSGKNSSSDILCILGGGVSSLSRSMGTLNFTMADGGNLQVSAGYSVDEAIKYTEQLSNSNYIYAKVGNTGSDNSFTYDADVQSYIGGEKGNTLVVSESADIFLTDGKFSNISEVDASNSSGVNILAGDTSCNTIIGGSGTSSLWGGSGSADDLLTGGSGQDMFWYGMNEGNDKIENAQSTDTLNLYNVSLSDIVSIEEISGGLKFNISTGSLTVNGSIPKVALTDGSWTYDSANKKWEPTT